MEYHFEILIKGEKMKSVVAQLNKLQGEAHAFYIAFHDYHWNVKGLQFFAVHEYTQKAYEEMGELFDEMAERALQIGGKALNDIDDIVKAGKSAPVEAKGDYKPEAVLKNVKKAYEYLLAEFKKLDEITQKDGDTTTSNLAQDKVAQLEKMLWMLNQAIA